MIGIIGGSGFYKFGKETKLQQVETLYGTIEVEISTVGDEQICFIPRHGKLHDTMPSMINYRGNILAGKQLGVKAFIVSNAVGVISRDYTVGELVLPTQVLDFTKNRASSFMPEINRLQLDIDQFSMHTDVSTPFDSELQTTIQDVVRSKEIEINRGGTIVVTEGPRFETPAEIEMYRKLGADFVGMTTSPEVFLANEINIPYVSLAVITNYAAGMQSKITEEEVFELFSENIEMIKQLFIDVILRLQS